MPTSSEAMGLFYFAESNLHVGSGNALSDIDLPIQRETHTNHPVVPASSIKGALRDLATSIAAGPIPRQFEAIFGPETTNASEHGGLGIFSESRLILFPVACSNGIFRWVTCPLVLNRLRRDLQIRMPDAFSEAARTAATNFLSFELPEPDGWHAAGVRGGGTVYFRDFEISIEPASDTDHVSAIADWFSLCALAASHTYWRSKLKKDLLVVNDEVFHHLVQYATHVDSHIKINSGTGVVEHGPWLEESLPADSLLWSSIDLPEPLENKVRDKLVGNTAAGWMRGLIGSSPRFQLGGSRSTGMGWVSVRELGG